MPAISIHYNLPIHLSKYLTHLLGEPYTIQPGDNIINRFILRSLSGKCYTIAKPSPEQEHKTKTFSVIVPPWVNEKYNAYTITPESEKDFILEVEKYFDSNLFSYIRAHQDIELAMNYLNLGRKAYHKKILSVKNAIERFVDVYGITETDIKLETLIKRYHRNRDKPVFS